ncbi:hypothetical protein UFOVP861_36 [uncultured Caudovirales phage]|uniref:Uncharacterized protein n=1 Tax=uncultured Caudovirales phage TaxID=2100421 RepID=A0A6J5PEV3_9CAUD|nr:hypothetical protein UFOVP861_36 [uncultured Caudovirales phage]
MTKTKLAFDSDQSPKPMTKTQIRNIQFIISILAILAFWIGYTVGRTCRVNMFNIEQTMSAISATADSAILHKNLGDDDSSSRVSAEESGRRTLATEKEYFVRKDEE